MLVDAQPGYVLHARPYRETSLLLELLTRDLGRVGAIVRGARRPARRRPTPAFGAFDPLALDLTLRGELALVRAAEPAGVPTTLAGEALICGLYVNELVLRLTARQDPHPALYERYCGVLADLYAGTALAWQLRRFERDLFAELGYALPLTRERGEDQPVRREAVYAFDPELGPLPVDEHPRGPRVDGEVLWRLAEDVAPDAAGLRQLRTLMRAQIRHVLGGRELNAWRMGNAPQGRA